jgi:hypothetical protein
VIASNQRGAEPRQEDRLPQRSYTGRSSTVLTRTWSAPEARLIVELLALYGIDAWTSAPSETNVYGSRGDGVDEIEVLVSERDLEEAASIVAEHAGDFLYEAGN